MTMTCDYCGTRYEEGEGYPSDDGYFCSMECDDLERVDRSELYYDTLREDPQFYDQQQADAETRTDQAIDYKREETL